MSDVRMQSIFLDEEFVYIQEDKSDVDRYNAQRTDHDRQASIAGHNSKKEQDEAKRERAKDAQSTRGSMKGTTKDSKDFYDHYNRNSKDIANTHEDVRKGVRKFNKNKSKHESAIMDMIDII